MRGSAGGLEKLSAGVRGLVKKTLDCTVVHDIHSCVFKNRRYQHGQGRQSMNNAKPYGEIHTPTDSGKIRDFAMPVLCPGMILLTVFSPNRGSAQLPL